MKKNTICRFLACLTLTALTISFVGKALAGCGEHRARYFEHPETSACDGKSLGDGCEYWTTSSACYYCNLGFPNEGCDQTTQYQVQTQNYVNGQCWYDFSGMHCDNAVPDGPPRPFDCLNTWTYTCGG